MTFLAPLLLLAAAALAVPLLVHRIRREDPTPHSFPALRYLARTIENREQRPRLHHLLLLLLRLMVIALLVLAAARLVLPLGDGTHPPASLVLVVDNGLHSGGVVEGERVLDALVRRAEEALRAMGPLDRVWLLAGGEPWSPSRPFTPPEALDRVSALEPTAVPADIPGLIERARALLDAADHGPAQILVLSTLAPSTFDVGEPGEAGVPAPTSGPPILLQGPGIERPPNRGISAVRIGGGLVPRAGEESVVEVELAGDEIGGVAVRLFLADELTAAARTDAEGRAALPLPAAPEGWLTGSVELDPDALRADDHRAFAVPVRPPPVVRVEGDPHPFLLQAIETLDEAGRIRIDTGAGGTSPDLVLYAGVAPTEPPVAGALRVILPPADATLLPATNRLLEQWGVPWRMEPSGTDERSPLDAAPPFPPSLDGIEVSTRTRLVPLAEGDEIPVRREDGQPWLVRSWTTEPEPSPVVLLGSSLHPEDSELPVSAAMIPFLDRLLSPPSPLVDPGASGGGGHPAGSPLPLPDGVTAVRTPAGLVHPVDGLPQLARTAEVGLHDLLGPEGEIVRSAAIHVSSAGVEGGVSLPPTEAASLLGPGVDAAPEGSGWTRSILVDRRGRELSVPLALLALALLMVEGWLAARISRGSRTPRTGGSVFSHSQSRTPPPHTGTGIR